MPGCKLASAIGLEVEYEGTEALAAATAGAPDRGLAAALLLLPGWCSPAKTLCRKGMVEGGIVILNVHFQCRH